MIPTAIAGSEQAQAGGWGASMQDQTKSSSIVNRLAAAWTVDPEWATPVDGGFRWWAHRLEQRITVTERPFGDPDDGMTEALLRAETTVLRDVPDQDAAVNLLAGINQRSGTFAFCCRPERRAVVAVSTAAMVGWYEPTFHWFSHAAMVQLVQAEHWAEGLAAELGAQPAVSAHPDSGPRPEPDEMLDWLGYAWSRPEWVIGSDELAPLIEPVAAVMEAGAGVVRGPRTDEMRVWPTGYNFPLANPWDEQLPFRAVVAGATRHPDLGPGTRIHITAPFTFGSSAAELVNRLNAGPGRSQTGLLGAWWASGGQAGFTGFLPQALFGPLLAREDLQDQRVDIVDALVRLVLLGQKMVFCSALEDSEISPRCAEPPTPLSGYGEPLDRMLLGAKRAIIAGAAQDTPEWSPDESRADPEDGQVLRTVDPDVLLAVFGTFNPAGPTLNTIGVIGLADGRYLLAHWMRHPSAPSYSPLLVLPDLSPETVRTALVQVLPGRGVGTATEFARVYAPGPLQNAVRAAFIMAARDRGRLSEFWDEAQALEKYRGDPWTAVSTGTPAGQPLPGDPAEILSRWWNAVTNEEHYFGYLRFLPGAWDDADRFIHAGRMWDAGEPDGTGQGAR
jgi:hypothetical protein